jgi:hypothetical protein
VTADGFGLVIGFIDHVQVVTTNNTVADFYTTHHFTLNFVSLLSLVFVAALNNGNSSAMIFTLFPGNRF